MIEKKTVSLFIEAIKLSLYFVMSFRLSIFSYTNVNFILKQLFQQKSDFTDNDINTFQRKAEEFFKSWLHLTGYNGVTTYIHMLGAGHLRYFLWKWRNLNRLSNQGWESYNALVAAYWHHRTTKGGIADDRSKILSIARWLSRMIMWRSSEGDSFFLLI
jgi:hypothetical protein